MWNWRALVHPSCKIWGLGLRGLSRKQALVFGDHALRYEKNRLRMLSLNDSSTPWKAMGGPTRKMEALVIAGDSENWADAYELPRLLRLASSKICYLEIPTMHAPTLEALHHSNKVTGAKVRAHCPVERLVPWQHSATVCSGYFGKAFHLWP
ncbi:hypothetical protein GOP47_0005736 [Adiantum capillus-veneris]|uniref:Uncharacterized protein n=1 Tax=Adiantum capillus-veneris TaxID=13818 RepID=A0A9D4ZNJ1_ADICA|nr:hypothetical protein GOP47_0005736 [Adiantum capillus-veneris]